MADEPVEIYDKNNEPLGITKLKSEAHRTGLWHRAAHVWIYNDRGELLMQKRAKTKDLFPDRYDISAAGHVTAGEDPISTALRETKEEIGIDIKKEDLRLLGIRKTQIIFERIRNNEFCYVYILRLNLDLKSLKLQKEEVSGVKMFKIDKLTEDLKAHPDMFVPHAYLNDLMAEVRRLTRTGDMPLKTY